MVSGSEANETRKLAGSYFYTREAEDLFKLKLKNKKNENHSQTFTLDKNQFASFFI